MQIENAKKLNMTNIINIDRNMMGRVLKISIPASISTIFTAITNVLCLKILGNINIINIYILSLFLPIHYFLMALYESIRAASLALSSKAIHHTEIENNIVHLIIYSIILLLISTIIFCFSGLSIEKMMHISTYSANRFYHFSICMVVLGILFSIVYVINSSLFSINKIFQGMMISILLSVITVSLTAATTHFFSDGLNAYLLSILISCIFSILVGFFMLRKNAINIFSRRNISLAKFLLKMKEITKISTPVFFSYSIIFISLFISNFILSHFDPNVLSGFGVAYRIQSLIILPAISIGTAMAILKSKNIKHDEKKLIFISGITVSLIIYFFFSLLIYIFRNELSEFISSNNQIIEKSAEYLKTVSLSYIGMGPMLSYLTMLEQTGSGMESFILNCIFIVSFLMVGGCIAYYENNYHIFYLSIAMMNCMSLFFIFMKVRNEVKIRLKANNYV